MVRITKNGNTVVIETARVKMAYPLGKLSAHYADESDSIDIKAMASRKVLTSFNWNEIEGATSKENAMEYINNQIN